MTTKNYILALDQGTTSSRALLIDRDGRISATEQQEFEQIYPQPGWVEHDPMSIRNSQLEVAKGVLKKHGIMGNDVAAIGITNQRETTLLWDRNTGKPVGNAIVWQDRRTAGMCDELRKKGLETAIQRKTGLLPDAYFSATKVQWMLDNIDGARAKAEKGDLAFGTVDTWLIWNLTGGNVHATDGTNASRTMLYNLQDLKWDPSLLDIFTVPPAVLPEVKDSSGIFGETDPELFGVSIPICGVAGDQQAALFGQMCTQPGMIKNTYGTGCFIVMNTGSTPIFSSNNLLTTLAWLMDGKPTYAIEGSIFIAGAVVQWLRDGLKIIGDSSAVEALAATVEDNGGVYIVPAFTGLGAPHWDAYARGTILGITRGTTHGHIARAALESIAYQTKDVLGAMAADANINTRELRVDGGASANNLLMQFQADILNIPVIRPKILETTAMGAGFLAGLAVDFWKNVGEIESLWQRDVMFSPVGNTEKTDEWLQYWQQAINRAKDWIFNK